MATNKHIKKAIITIIILVVVVIVGFMIIKPPIKLPAPVAIDTTGQPTLGNANAKIHIVAFEDLKCANCARFSNTIFPKLKQKYIDTGVANYTMINLAFIPGSLPAANAARCVYMQNHHAFFDYIAEIYQDQPPENENWATIPALLTFAANVKGIDTDKLVACLVQNPYDSFMQDNLKIAISVMKQTVATPAIYINGIAVKPLSEKQIDRIIEAVK